MNAALLLGALGTTVVFGAAFINPGVALSAWLVAALIVTMVPIGALPWLLTWFLHRGRWGRVIGRPMQAAVATLPVTAVLLLPVFLAAGAIYGWPHQDGAHATPWLQVGWFGVRGFIYVLSWAALAVLAVRFGRSLNDAPHRPGLASVGLIVWSLTTSFAAIDWGLSLQPETHSSIYGMIYMAHLMIGALVFLIVVSLALRPVSAEASSGLANILLGSVMMWAYLHFMQYLIAWSGDLPGHIQIYVPRLEGVWGWLLLAIALGHGLVPFVLLLRGPIRRSARWVLVIAALILALRVAEGLWLWLPAFPADSLRLVLVGAGLVGCGGLWAAAWLWCRARLPDEEAADG